MFLSFCNGVAISFLFDVVLLMAGMAWLDDFYRHFMYCRFDNIPVEVTGNAPPVAIQTFDELLLPDTLKANLAKAEFTKPTPVQKHAMPAILMGRDVMACAQTGSGKTVSMQSVTKVSVGWD